MYKSKFCVTYYVVEVVKLMFYLQEKLITHIAAHENSDFYKIIVSIEN